MLYIDIPLMVGDDGRKLEAMICMSGVGHESFPESLLPDRKGHKPDKNLTKSSQSRWFEEVQIHFRVDMIRVFSMFTYPFSYRYPAVYARIPSAFFLSLAVKKGSGRDFGSKP